VIEKLRLFLTILEEGSLRRAAQRCRIAQSAITRQIQLLEHDLGGRVLERTSAGVRPTSGGHALAEKARTLLADYDSAMAEVRRLVRGESDRLRIGYIASAVQEYLEPALVELRRRYPKLKIKMLDQTPAEMITALRRGEIDLAFTAYGAEALSGDFYMHKLASVPGLVTLPLDHPLAHHKQISISQLKKESFVGARDSILPGYNQKIVQFCRQFGKFRPRFVAIGQPSDLADALATAANEGAIALTGSFISHLEIPNVVMVPIAEKEATWDLFVVWQRGKTAGPLRALVDYLQSKPKAPRRLEAPKAQSRASS
jgi:molybdate transport repressor ModE-like protein